MGLLLLTNQSTQAADLVVFSAAAMKGAFEQVPAAFYALTGDHVGFIFGTAGQIRDRVISGEHVDLVIVPPAPMADLGERNFVRKESSAALAVVRLGAAVRSGAALPSIANERAFTQALLEAPSIGMADPSTGATSGIYLAKLIDRLGISQQIKTRITYYPEGQAAMEAVGRGEIQLGLGQISEIMPVHSVVLIGPIPKDLQLRTTYVGAIASNTDQPETVQRLLTYLLGPVVRKALSENGFDSGS